MLQPVAAPAGDVRREGDAVFWTCPACGRENPFESSKCSVCGTALATLFTPPAAIVEPPNRSVVLALSAILPGAGHVKAGMVAAGAARTLLWAWTMLIGLWLALRTVRGNQGVARGLGIVFLLCAAAIWTVSLAEMSRASRGDRTLILAGRTLTVATAALTFALFAGLVLITQTS